MTRRRRKLRRRTLRRGIATALAVLVLSALVWWNDSVHAGSWSRREILDAIRWVESRWNDAPPDGDGGRAIGPYQIHRGYWLDATGHDPELGGSYDDCRRRAYAERVIAAYMERYAAAAWASNDAETIARTHNGGPTGPSKSATDRYWRRVRAALP